MSLKYEGNGYSRNTDNIKTTYYDVTVSAGGVCDTTGLDTLTFNTDADYRYNENQMFIVGLTYTSIQFT